MNRTTEEQPPVKRLYDAMVECEGRCMGGLKCPDHNRQLMLRGYCNACIKKTRKERRKLEKYGDKTCNL